MYDNHCFVEQLENFEYKAVLETNVKNVDEFLLLFKASNSSLWRSLTF